MVFNTKWHRQPLSRGIIRSLKTVIERALRRPAMVWWWWCCRMKEVLLQKGNRESFGKRYLWRLSWVYKRRNGVIIGSFCSLVIQTKTLGKYLTSPPTMLLQCNGDKWNAQYPKTSSEGALKITILRQTHSPSKEENTRSLGSNSEWPILKCTYWYGSQNVIKPFLPSFFVICDKRSLFQG